MLTRTTKLEGVMLNFGTAVMGPEVYLKAASARNVALSRRGGRSASSRQPSST
ncbi:MAG: hypothetical protein U0797_27305 [Gemmataceae bacterium]